MRKTCLNWLSRSCKKIGIKNALSEGKDKNSKKRKYDVKSIENVSGTDKYVLHKKSTLKNVKKKKEL